MLTNKERIDEMHRRAALLEQQRRNRIVRISGIAAAAASLTIILAVAAVVPGWEETIALTPAANMRASIFSANGALGYIIVGLLAFALGILFTAFCYRLRKWRSENRNPTQEDSRDRDD